MICPHYLEHAESIEDIYKDKLHIKKNKKNILLEKLKILHQEADFRLRQKFLLTKKFKSIDFLPFNSSGEISSVGKSEIFTKTFKRN